MNEKLQIIDDYIYTTLAELLFEIVPQYKGFLKNHLERTEKLGDYTFMNHFSVRLCSELKEDPLSEFVICAFKFINGLSESKNLEILNILKVGILEILYTEDATIRSIATSQLNARNKILFEQFSKWYF